MSEDRLKVLIVDDTALYRRILSDVLDGFPEVEVVGTAPHGRLALAKLEQNPADLVLLDVEMPEMDGPETLREIRQHHRSTAVIMISGSNLIAVNYTVQALEMGALDFIRKPEGVSADASRAELRDLLRPLIRHVQTRVNLNRVDAPEPVKSAPVVRFRSEIRSEPMLLGRPPALPTRPPTPSRQAPAPSRFDVVGIGVSTGGPNALLEVIPHLPKDLPVPVLLVQHMPPIFTASLAEHLNQKSLLEVREAQEGEPVAAGRVYIAPGGKHMVIRRRTQSDGVEGFIIGLNENPPENSCRPSVDVLFRSLAANFDGNMLSVVMTGMGNDGCEGVRAMKRRGCHCITQSEETCVVYGMPFAVDEAELSDERVPLDRIADRIASLVWKGRSH